ncbi:AEC family transporter [Chamaesiphon sp. VAR_48_metabat_135_sub]|uniref:AEC family transporter n=1 Tax=Chamaesiphon sp. VAR_48_metabat_135_sub TaxID=2964699 RepID=UPI00286A6FC1|nr:AEC family transporter [Chamaesiphon sp. VAR_48_metabat_135_sub]
MLDRLVQAYTPLICWTGLGILSVRFLPSAFPHWLGRGLYWIGVPIEIFSLARQTTFDERAQLAPTITIASLLLGLGLGWISLAIWQRLQPDLPARTPGLQGSLLLCSMLGNTGFVGLAIVPFFVSELDLSWAVLYSVTQNVFGTYGLGVLVSSYYGRQGTGSNQWWMQFKDLLSVPSLWGFALGSLTRTIPLPKLVESSLHASIWVVIPGAFILMGIRLSQIQGWQSLKLALLPAILKTIVMPTIVGISITMMGMSGDPRLGLVLMSGMPCAFAGLILAEEYNLNGNLVASSIIVSTAIFLAMIPVWLYLY